MGAREWMALLFVVLLCIVAGFKEPRFFQAGSVNSILLWMPLIVVVAMGEMMVIITRGIDISVGSNVGFSAIGVGLLVKANPHMPVWLALLAGLGIGLVLGAFNASLVTWGKLSPLIVTIGTLAAFRGLTFLTSKGSQIDPSMVPDPLTSLARTGIHFGQVTVSALLLVALSIALLTAIFLKLTRLGRNIFAYGGNPDASYLRGISSNSVNFFVYSVCGALAGLAGAMYLSRFGFANPGSAGQSFELTVIAAVAIGGAKLTGGSGSVFGVLMGCLLLSCINVGLSVLGIDENWQMLSYGLVILIAIILDATTTRISERRRARA
jgi:rhamnose transport system permease protein